MHFCLSSSGCESVVAVSAPRLKISHFHTPADPTPKTGGDEVATEQIQEAGTGEATKKKKKKKKKGGASGAEDDYLHPLSNPTGTITMALLKVHYLYIL